MFNSKSLASILILHLSVLGVTNSVGQIKSLETQYNEYQDSVWFFHATGEYNKSLFYFDKLIEVYPESTYNILSKGALLHELHAYNEAIEEFSKVIKINPNVIDAYVRRGRSYLNLHQYDSSILDFNRAYGQYRYQDSTLFLYRAYAYLMKDEIRSAQADNDSSRHFYVNEKTFLHAKARVAIETHDYKIALNDLNKSLSIDSSNLDVLKDRALVNSQLNNYDAALKDSWIYLKHYPDDEAVNLIVGVILLIRKDYYKVLPYLNKCGKKIITKQVFLARGFANYYLANDQLSIHDLQRALRLYPTQEEQAQIYSIIGTCKNNIKPKTGCEDLLKASALGLVEAKRIYLDECK
ncbi:MAG TPA: hypothetical protein PLJ60_12310 [Chryseolinea sp.]|nr:hypothetical protein [Chryseolinea sp.]HPM31107.1 hypothetical protein [Chryseolinea sp.]